MPAESEAIKVAYGTTYDVATGKKHEFSLPPDWMTISFLIESAGAVEVGYPKYVLKSSDGAYDKTLTAKDDLVPGDKYLQLKFEKLLPGKKYTLTAFHDAEISRVVFENASYGEIVDQERSMHEQFVEHGYAELIFEDVEGKVFDDWTDDGAA